MFISDQEALERGIDVRAWAAAMQRMAREPETKPFGLKGPITLNVRKRRPSGPMATSVSRYAFIGHEVFRLSGVSQELDAAKRGRTISMQFTPIDLELVKEVSGMTLTLDHAMNAFDGLEEWCMSMQMAAGVVAPGEARTAARPADERAANPVWGSW